MVLVSFVSSRRAAGIRLATNPETFKAGGIIAGLPGAAANATEAVECMSNARQRSRREWGDLIRAASSHRGPWPRVSVWHGGDDPLVRWAA
jgi:poly(3-hydroxybutyrate) depolymerase